MGRVKKPEFGVNDLQTKYPEIAKEEVRTPTVRFVKKRKVKR